MKTILLNKVREQEQFMLKLRDRLLLRDIKLDENKSWLYERAKMIGMIDMLDALSIDRSEFNWIF